jgi:S1-C subfamily serine protease
MKAMPRGDADCLKSRRSDLHLPNAMKNTYRTFAFIVQFAVLGLAIAFVIGLYAPKTTDRLRGALGITSKTNTAQSSSGATVSSSTPSVEIPTASFPPKSRDPLEESAVVSYASAVNRAAPSVVSLYANKLVPGRRLLVPNDPVLRRMVGFIDAGPTQAHESSLGSGVVTSSDGYVLTNNHVIEGAEEIQAVLNDGRIIKAMLVGADPDTDLAVLKLDAANLPVIPISQTHTVHVGDVALAIGNPFGKRNTVTMGIISAVGRQLNASSYEDFIQTDAAINDGNSGGALVNAYGELVGINSSVFSPSNVGNIGIGFAIPVGTAKSVLEEIVAHGKVIRGWLGAEYVDVQPAPGSLASGALVKVIYDKSPAAQAGLQAGDTLLSLNNEPIKNPVDLRTREAAFAPGTKVEVSGMRKGSPFKATIVLEERPRLQQAG